MTSRGQGQRSPGPWYLGQTLGGSERTGARGQSLCPIYWLRVQGDNPPGGWRDACGGCQGDPSPGEESGGSGTAVSRR